MFNSINVSASGLTAERLRMDLIARNIAGANITRTASGTPYRRKIPILREKSNSFETILNKALRKADSGGGVEVLRVEEDPSPFKQIYNPAHPDANDKGIVLMPNVDTVTEMVNLISATRAYEANVTSINTAKGMAMKALEIGR